MLHLVIFFIRESQSSVVIDARESAPHKATKDMFQGNSSLSQEGNKCIFSLILTFTDF